MSGSGITIGERFDSPEITVKPPSARIKYNVTGTSNMQDAILAVRGYVPTTYTVAYVSCPLQNIGAEPGENGADTFWIVTANYYLSTFPVNYDTSGATTKLMHSLKTKHVYRSPTAGSGMGSGWSAGSAIPDKPGGIGWNGTDYDGVEVPIPNFTWTETHQMPIYIIENWKYAMVLATMTGCVNNATFRGFDAGEVRFDGVQGGTQKDDFYGDIIFKFTASPNSYRYEDNTMQKLYDYSCGSAVVANFSDIGTVSGLVGPADYNKIVYFTRHPAYIERGSGSGLCVGDITHIDKDGWDYMWVLYRDEVSGDFHTKKVIGVYVEKVLYDADFSQLGIGT